MIPMIDDYLMYFLVEKLTWLKKHPSIIDKLFSTCRRETAKKLKDFIVNEKLRVVIGFPRDVNALPAYVITLAPEEEQPISLGDDVGFYETFGLGDEELLDPTAEEIAERKTLQYLNSTLMNSNYRIECWSDNGDMTMYLYTILKWCLWSSRVDMLKLGWADISLSGTDFEPIPDYLPCFVYRRAVQINLKYENLYYQDFDRLDKILDVLDNPANYYVSEQGDVCKKETHEIVIPMNYVFKLQAHYYRETGEHLGDITSVTGPTREILYKFVDDII